MDGHTFMATLDFYGPKRLILPPEAQITQFLNRKRGQKWIKIYQKRIVKIMKRISDTRKLSENSSTN